MADSLPEISFEALATPEPVQVLCEDDRERGFRTATFIYTGNSANSTFAMDIGGQDSVRHSVGVPVDRLTLPVVVGITVPYDYDMLHQRRVIELAGLEIARTLLPDSRINPGEFHAVYPADARAALFRELFAEYVKIPESGRNLRSLRFTFLDRCIGNMRNAAYQLATMPSWPEDESPGQ